LDGNEYLSLKKQGNVRIDAHFNTALPHTVNCIVLEILSLGTGRYVKGYTMSSQIHPFICVDYESDRKGMQPYR
jgi:hypothetical protein